MIYFAKVHGTQYNQTTTISYPHIIFEIIL